MKPKHVVSVGLGSSSRDAYIETELLGQPIIIERRGTEGNMQAAASLLEELDGKVDAFGLGGIVLFIQAAGKRYYLRDAVKLAKHAKVTPVVCGAGLKDTLERTVVRQLGSRLNWHNQKVLMVSGAENFGMAEALDDLGASVTYIDIPMSLGLNIPLRNLTQLTRVARLLAPIATQLPISWLYPTGKQQESHKTDWRSKFFDAANVITGDFHFILRYAPEDLAGKVILTNTTTQENVDLLKTRGVKTLITSTPRYDGRSLSTNMLEAAFVALSGKHPLSAADYQQLIAESGLKPNVLDLN